MKTLPTNAEAARAASEHGPRWILDIDWSQDGTWSGHYSDQAFTIVTTSYEAYVLKWQDNRNSLDLKSIGSTDDFIVIMKNADNAKFYTLAIQNNIEGKDIRFGIWFRREVNYTLYPNAPEKSIGRKIPIIYGWVRYPEAIELIGNRATNLFGALTEDATDIPVESAVDFPNSGSIVIDGEVISYASVDRSYTHQGEIVSAFRSCTRGTPPAAHADGAQVARASSSLWAFADHAIRALFAPLVNMHVPADTYSQQGGISNARVLFPSRPARYRAFASGSESVAIVPNAVAGDNGAANAENVIKPLESNEYAVVSTSATPLSLDQTTDLSDYDDSKGAPVKARIGVEFDPSEDFTVGQITATIT